MTLVDDLLADIDAIRGDIPAAAGTRLFRVYVLKRTWSGDRVGHGTSTDAETELTCRGSSPRVTQISDHDIISSGGFYNAGDIKVGPLTPAYAGGGVSYAMFVPQPTSTPTQIFFRVTGPGYQTGGSYFRMVSNDGNFSTSITIVLRQLAAKP